MVVDWDVCPVCKPTRFQCHNRGKAPFTYHSYSLDYRRMSFVAQTALLPADIDVRQPRTYLQSVLDDRAQRRFCIGR